VSAEFPPRLTPPEQVRREPRPIVVHDRGGFGRWLRWQFPLLFVVAGLVFVSHQTRTSQANTQNHNAQVFVRSQRTACRNSLARTYENMESWYGAYKARLIDASTMVGDAQASALAAAKDYLTTVRNDMRFVDAKHSVTWPRDAKGKGAHPLGLGHFSCARANPYPPKIVVHWYDFG
jgi:hypothetical protein